MGKRKGNPCSNGYGKNKIRYTSAADAHEVLWRKHRNDSMDVYLCKGCRYWHIGHRSLRPLPKRFYVGAKHQEHDEALIGKLIGVLKELINGKENARHQGYHRPRPTNGKSRT